MASLTESPSNQVTHHHLSYHLQAKCEKANKAKTQKGQKGMREEDNV